MMKTFIRTITIILALVIAVALVLPAQAEEQYERVLVQFSPGRGADLQQGPITPNAQVTHRFDEANIVAMTLPASEVEALRNDPSVLTVEPDFPRYLAEQVVPYGVENIEGRALWDANQDGVVDAGAPDGSGQLVCIIDSGVNVNHEDFAGVNFVGGYPSDWNTDGCGHGTHVAGTIAAMNNGTGVVGVSPGAVSLFIVKIFNDSCGLSYSSALIDGVYKCRDAGADIISMSLEGPNYSSLENYVFNSVYNQGILNVAAAGNGGGTAYGYPASYGAVISVGAVDQNNVVAGFSRQNDQVEVVAPGVSILSTYKDGGYHYMNGTSMAAPHVAAAAALVWSGEPTKTNVEIREALRQTGNDLGDPGRDNAYGYGLVLAEAAYDSFNEAPTAVEMARFEVVDSGDAIQVQWETATELNILGFNLYRAESQDGPQTLITGNLVPSQSPGSPVGATYSFVDDTAAAGTLYYYWLEAIEANGDSTHHGPVSGSTGSKATFRVFLPSVFR